MAGFEVDGFRWLVYYQVDDRDMQDFAKEHIPGHKVYVMYDLEGWDWNFNPARGLPVLVVAENLEDDDMHPGNLLSGMFYTNGPVFGRSFVIPEELFEGNVWHGNLEELWLKH